MSPPRDLADMFIYGIAPKRGNRQAVHKVVVGDQPHDGCDVCDLRNALKEITAVDGEGTPIHDRIAMYQIAADALDTAQTGKEQSDG
jgi:hypothetical protein